jgi:hypothetical protein
MPSGMILLTVVVTLFLGVVVLPIVGGGICGSVICMRDVLRKMRASCRETAQTENRYAQKPHFSVLK